MGLVQGVDDQQSRRVPLGEEHAEGRADPGAAQVSELVERARHDGLTDVAACAEQARAGGVER